MKDTETIQAQQGKIVFATGNPLDEMDREAVAGYIAMEILGWKINPRTNVWWDGFTDTIFTTAENEDNDWLVSSSTKAFNPLCETLSMMEVFKKIINKCFFTVDYDEKECLWLVGAYNRVSLRGTKQRGRVLEEAVCAAAIKLKQNGNL